MTNHFTAIHGEHAARMIVLELIGESADRVGLSVRKLMSEDRTAPIVQARQWAMYEAFHRGCTQPQIGRVLDLDHTTILHGIKAETERRTAHELRMGIPVFHRIRERKCSPAKSQLGTVASFWAIVSPSDRCWGRLMPW